jgi:hypothetical protein
MVDGAGTHHLDPPDDEHVAVDDPLDRVLAMLLPECRPPGDDLAP